MLMTPHAALGLAIVSKVGNPFYSLPLALFSHFALDIFPHWNWHPDRRPLSLLGIGVDFVLAGGMIAFFARGFSDPLVAVLGGALPAFVDILDAPYYFFGWGGFWERYTRFSRGYQTRVSPFFGILNQLLVVLVSLFLLSS